MIDMQRTRSRIIVGTTLLSFACARNSRPLALERVCPLDRAPIALRSDSTAAGPGILRGRVYDTLSTQIILGEAVLESVTGQRWRTAAESVFVFRGLAPGVYRLRLWGLASYARIDTITLSADTGRSVIAHVRRVQVTDVCGF